MVVPGNNESLKQGGLYVFTSNPGKLRELQAAFGDIPVSSLREVLETLPSVVEDGKTFEANARLKALAGAVASRRPTLADDSGLEVDALGGAPGVRSDRFAMDRGRVSESADRLERSRANNDLLQDLLKTTPQELRSARFVCALCCMVPDDWIVHGRVGGPGLDMEHNLAGSGWTSVVVRGVCEGRIEFKAAGAGGFGYDPLFWSLELERTFGEVSSLEKMQVSHRARAAQRLVGYLMEAGVL